MIDYDNAQHHHSECIFRMADSEEISAPQPFQHLHHSPEWVWLNQKAATASTIFGHDTTDDHIRVLKDKFEKPKRIVPIDDIMGEERLPQPKIIKGKRRSQVLTEEDYLQLWQQWHDEFADIVNGTRNQLPLWREVNHEIHLIDDNKQYKYFTPQCPNSLHKELHAKVNRYVNSGWWEPRSVKQAAPLLCIPKKDRKLRTMVNARQQNDNIIKDVTPLPDQEVIWKDVVRAKICSKIDLTDPYEQVRVWPEDVVKNAFTTILGTYVSHVMWIGDCNAPATFQRLMTTIFCDAIGHSMHVYLDDIFVYSNTIEEHKEHLWFIFEKLWKFLLYLKWVKCDLYAERFDCLGHIIDKEGVTALLSPSHIPILSL